MDMDLKDFMEFLQTAARSVGAEVSSPWFYLQFGLILAAAGIAYAADAGGSQPGRHDLAGDALAAAAPALRPRDGLAAPRRRCSPCW